MNTKRITALILFISTLFFYTCGSDDNIIEDPPITNNNIFSAKIDGELVEFENASGSMNVGQGYLLGVDGYNENPYKDISIFFDTLDVGTYPLFFNSPNRMDYYPAFGSNFVKTAKSGSLTIAIHDAAAKRIEGTFDFVTGFSDSVVVTEGIYKVTYR